VPNPGILQSVEEHEENPKKEATIMPVGGLMKRLRGSNMAAIRRQMAKGSSQASFCITE
jgi:hypothetical protein